MRNEAALPKTSREQLLLKDDGEESDREKEEEVTQFNNMQTNSYCDESRKTTSARAPSLTYSANVRASLPLQMEA